MSEPAEEKLTQKRKVRKRSIINNGELKELDTPLVNKDSNTYDAPNPWSDSNG